jgi:hypothetical protein
MASSSIRIGLCLAACLALAGCGLSEQARQAQLQRKAAFEAELNGLLGRSIDEVVAGRGAPDKTFRFASGDRLYEWNDERVEESGGYIYHDPVRTYTRRSKRNPDGTLDHYTERSTTWVPQRTPIRRQVYECNVRLTTDARRRILRWAYDGNGCY